MHYTQGIIEGKGIIETTLSNGITARELKLGIEEAFQLSAARGIDRYLVDASKINSFIPLDQLYALPGLFQSLGLPHSSLIAVLCSWTQRGRERARFFTHVCLNRGWQAGMFFHRRAALDWLREE